MKLFGSSRKQAARQQEAAEAIVRPDAELADRRPAVAFDDVSLKIGHNEILHHLTFQIAPGTICGMLAPSGGGKTTTLRLILGVYAPTSGGVLVLGKAPDCFSLAERRQMGYMPQNFVLYPELSVRSNLKFVAGIYGLPRRGRSRRIDELVRMVDLEEARNRRASKLSGGMQRRLQLAATLIHNPQVLIIDEPTAGIDPLLRARFWEYFRHLRDQGHTLIISTQYVTEAEYCDQVLLLRAGKLIASGAPDALRDQAFGPGYLTESGRHPTFEAVFLKLMQEAASEDAA
jgi:ABC-2 type transport system ATP-binding protein